jgi:hypothetical protein
MYKNIKKKHKLSTPEHGDFFFLINMFIYLKYFLHFRYSTISTVYLFLYSAREWRRLHNEELYAPYSSPNIIQMIKSGRLTGHVACMRERKGTYRVLVGKT